MIPAREIDVSVFDGPVWIQKWPCSSTTMPDGSPGVLWRGTAYALLPGERIDVGSAQDPSKAHAVISGEEASWVLIRGTADSLRAATASLRDGGIAVARSGRWLGDPVEGIEFDWYLRCSGALDPLVIASLLGRPPSSAATVDGASRSLVLEHRIASLLADVARLQQAVDARAAEVPPDPRPGEVPPLGDVPDQSGALDDAFRRLAEAESELARLRSGRIPTRPAPKLAEELSAAFLALRPDLQLLRGSLTVAVGEYSSRTGFYRAVQDLPPTGARPEGWKMLRGADRWWERHVSTGRDDSGRAYARFDAESRRWSLLISWKSDQAGDIAWLRAL